MGPALHTTTTTIACSQVVVVHNFFSTSPRGVKWRLMYRWLREQGVLTDTDLSSKYACPKFDPQVGGHMGPRTPRLLLEAPHLDTTHVSPLCTFGSHKAPVYCITEINLRLHSAPLQAAAPMCPNRLIWFQTVLPPVRAPLRSTR